MEIILFILLLGVAWYGYDTRQRLRNVAELIDKAHAIIDRGFAEDRVRLDKLEKAKKSKQ